MVKSGPGRGRKKRTKACQDTAPGWQLPTCTPGLCSQVPAAEWLAGFTTASPSFPLSLPASLPGALPETSNCWVEGFSWHPRRARHGAVCMRVHGPGLPPQQPAPAETAVAGVLQLHGQMASGDSLQTLPAGGTRGDAFLVAPARLWLWE